MALMPHDEVIAWLESETGQAWSREQHSRSVVSWFQLKDDITGVPWAFHFWDYREFDESEFPVALATALV
jgi:hypothetical protein